MSPTTAIVLAELRIQPAKAMDLPRRPLCKIVGIHSNQILWHVRVLRDAGLIALHRGYLWAAVTDVPPPLPLFESAEDKILQALSNGKRLTVAQISVTTGISRGRVWWNLCRIPEARSDGGYPALWALIRVTP